MINDSWPRSKAKANCLQGIHVIALEFRLRGRTASRALMTNELQADLYGWWRILETSQWVNEGLDDLGPAMLSITGDKDRLRMHCLLAYVHGKPTKSGASFTWEYDPISG